MDQYIRNLSYVISNCNMDNTYKMAWVRSLVESCVLNPKKDEFHFDDLARLIVGYYWNQTIFFQLEQGPNPHKKPEIHQIVMDMIREYEKENGFQPIYFTKAEKYLTISLKTISTVLKKDVCWRFQELNRESYSFYELDRENRKLRINHPELIREYSEILFELINYRWTQKLEEMNSSPRVSQKVKGTDREKIRRKNLGVFKGYLDIENPNRISFITRRPISEENLSIDHVIPWSYLYSDDLWNLVYVEKSENSAKNNRIPSEDMITRLEQRNRTLLKLSEEQGIINKHVEELKISIERDYVKKFWVGFKG
jgi:hypothetical protein